MAFIAKETFQSYTNTNPLSGLNGGSGWTNAWTIGSGTGFTITNTQGDGSSLSACRITGSTSVASYYRNFAAVPAGVAYFSVRTSDVTASVGTQITLGIGAGAPSADIAFRIGGLSGHLEYLSGGGAGWTDIQAVSNDTWYRIGVEWDTVNQVNKFRYNINNGAFSSWVTGGTSIGSITGIQLTNAGNGQAANSYFDNILPTYLDTDDRYWVGGAGNWDSSTTTHWSYISNGPGGSSVPIATTSNVFFDANAGVGTTTVTATAVCTNLNFTGYTQTFAGSSALDISGNLLLVSGMTLTYTGAITFNSTSTGKTITTGTIPILSALTFNGSGGGWTLQDNLTAVSITLTAGTLSLSSTTASLTGTGTLWNANGGAISAGTSTIKLTDASASTKTFAGGGLTYNNLWITGAGAGAYTITGSNTFVDFKCDTPPHTINFTAGTTQTLQTFTVNGTAGNLMTLQSTASGFNWFLHKSTVGTISCDYLSVKDSTVS